MRRHYYTHGQSCPCDDCWNREQRRRKAAQQRNGSDFDDTVDGESLREGNALQARYGLRPIGGR